MKMSGKINFPVFHFFPQGLHNESIRLKKKYRQAEEIPEGLRIRKLPDLLEQIRALDDDKNAVMDYAHTLKSIDINILATEYPYEKENQRTIRKIMIILTERYNKIVGRRFWVHFQNDPFDSTIKSILKHAVAVQNDFPVKDVTIREIYQQSFSSNDTLGNLAKYIAEEEDVLNNSFKRWKIYEKSRLGRELWLRILQLYMDKQWFIDKQGVSSIIEKIENLSLEDYKGIINNYFLGFAFHRYYPEFVNQAISRLADPRVNLHRWQGMSDDAIKKVSMWLYERELHDFFDYERFEYWRKYLRQIEDLKVIQDPPVAAMYFRDFVAVEFANIGNAAYFYEEKGFSKFLAPKLTAHYVSEGILKDRDSDFFIHKLNHAGNWPSRFDEYMMHYLRGDFWYRH